MKSLLLLLLMTLSVSGSTITGNFFNFLGTNYTTNLVTISSRSFPQSIGGKFYFGTVQTTYLTNGLLNVTLPISGQYNLSFQGLGNVLIIIPQDTNTYDIAQVATNLTVFTYTNILPFISGLVKPGNNLQATTNNAGTPAETVTFSVLGFTNSLQLATNAFFPTPINATGFLTTSNYDLWWITPLATNRVALGH